MKPAPSSMLCFSNAAQPCDLATDGNDHFQTVVMANAEMTGRWPLLSSGTLKVQARSRLLVHFPGRSPSLQIWERSASMIGMSEVDACDNDVTRPPVLGACADLRILLCYASNKRRGGATSASFTCWLDLLGNKENRDSTCPGCAT